MKRNKMKKIKNLSQSMYLGWVLSICMNLSIVWVGIELFIHLFKNKDFNWWSVYISSILFVIFIIYFLISTFNFKNIRK